MRARNANLSPENVRIYVDKAFDNAHKLDVLNDDQLKKIKTIIYHRYEDDEGVAEEVMINKDIDKMLEEATVGNTA